MKTITCLELNNLAFPISLKQTGIDSYTVTYGLQIKKQLTYERAAQELGYSIMHALACDGKLENGEEVQS